MNKVKVLLVDDDPELLRAHKRLIGVLDCADQIDIVIANGVVEGFAAFSFAMATGSSFDIVVSDIDMKDGTGFDLVAMMQDRFLDQCPRLVLVTGWIDANKQILAHKANCELIDKMYFSTDVLPMLRALVKSKVGNGIQP